MNNPSMSNKPLVMDSLELANRINRSTDIVTGLTDVVEEQLPLKSLQGENTLATNTYILDAINNITIDTSTLAKEDTLTSGISQVSDQITGLYGGDTSATLSSIKSAVEHIDIDTTELAKQGSNPNATLSETQSQVISAAADAATAKLAAMDAKSAALQAKSAAETVTGFALQGPDSTATNTALMQSLTNIISQHLIIGGQVMDGIEFMEGFQVKGALDVIENKDKIISITDNVTTTMPCYATFAGMSNLREIHMSNLETTTNGDGTTFSGCISLKVIDMPKLTTFSGRLTLGLASLTTVDLPSLVALQSISLQSASRLVEVNLPSLTDGFGSNGLASSGVPLRINYHNYRSGFVTSGSGSTSFHNTRDCQFLDVTNVTGWNVNMLQSSRYPDNLIDFRIGAGMTTSFALQNYRPINAMRFDTDSLLTDEDRQAGFTSNGEKLLYNLKHYFADNLQDRSEEEFATVTLHQDLYDFIDTYGQDIVETVEDKNWYLIS